MSQEYAGEKRREDDSMNRLNQDQAESEVSDRTSKRFLFTLPCRFKSLVGTSIRMNSERPRDVIESLGRALGVTDYETNMASFWFLDVLALQVLRYKDDVDEHYRGVLISWLAGAMKLIQDRKLDREEFFEEMTDIFNATAEKISECNEVLYWDQIVDWDGKESMEEGEHDSLEEYVSSLKESGSQGSGTHLPRKHFKESTETEPSSQEYILPESSLDPTTVLLIIIEAIYETYANELRYALIQAVFVEAVEINTYYLPFLLRTPRPVKVLDSETGPFGIQLQRKLEKSGLLGEPHDKLKTKVQKNKQKVQGQVTIEVPATPTHSLTDEEELTEKCRFLLPLIEANEAPVLLELYNGNT